MARQFCKYGKQDFTNMVDNPGGTNGVPVARLRLSRSRGQLGHVLQQHRNKKQNKMSCETHNFLLHQAKTQTFCAGLYSFLYLATSFPGQLCLLIFP